MTVQKAISELQFFKEKLHNGIFGDRTGVFDVAISALEEIQQYRALGTVEELQEAKVQYENINSCAEGISLSGLCDYKTARNNIVSSLKAMKKQGEKEQ